MLTRLRALLFPPPGDEGFRQELVEDAAFGAMILGGLELLLALRLPMPALAYGAGLGAVTLASLRIPALYEHLRYIALGSAFLWEAFAAATDSSLVAAVVICAFALLPQTFLQAVPWALAIALVSKGAWPFALAGAVLAPVIYKARRERYLSHLLLVQSTQDLRQQQERAMAAEYATSLERLAAAMSHELNTPVGAIQSSVQTLRSITGKLAGADEGRRQSLIGLQDDVCRCLLDSGVRVQAIVARLQRLTGLDRAAVRPTDMNQVLQDVAASVEAGASGEVPVRLTLRPLPVILCETQAWVTVLTKLVSHAVSQPGQRGLDISSDVNGDCIVVALTEVGRETEPAQLARALQPAFAETGGRIGTANWSLFQVRGWVRQLGGDLRLSSDDRGTITRLTIPAQHTDAAAAAHRHGS
jgi:signal transduction histidine kinase